MLRRCLLLLAFSQVSVVTVACHPCTDSGPSSGGSSGSSGTTAGAAGAGGLETGTATPPPTCTCDCPEGPPPCAPGSTLCPIDPFCTKAANDCPDPLNPATCAPCCKGFQPPGVCWHHECTALPTCGDGWCTAGETCETCPAECGSCPPSN